MIFSDLTLKKSRDPLQIFLVLQIYIKLQLHLILKLSVSAKVNKDGKLEQCKPITKVEWKSSRSGYAFFNC